MIVKFNYYNAEEKAFKTKTCYTQEEYFDTMLLLQDIDDINLEIDSVSYPGEQIVVFNVVSFEDPYTFADLYEDIWQVTGFGGQPLCTKTATHF